MDTDKNAEYRANAQECARISAYTTNAEDKKRWLNLSAAWLRMVLRLERSPDEPDAAKDMAERSTAQK